MLRGPPWSPTASSETQQRQSPHAVPTTHRWEHHGCTPSQPEPPLQSVGQTLHFSSQRHSQQDSAFRANACVDENFRFTNEGFSIKKKKKVILIWWSFLLTTLFLPIKRHVSSSYCIMSYCDRNNSWNILTLFSITITKRGCYLEPFETPSLCV